jgi:hypothetical protein
MGGKAEKRKSGKAEKINIRVLCSYVGTEWKYKTDCDGK